MNPTRARKLIRALVGAGCIRFTEHARRRMLERDVARREVMRAILESRLCKSQPNRRWRLASTELVVVVQIELDALVVTLFRGDEDEDEEEDEEG